MHPLRRLCLVLALLFFCSATAHAEDACLESPDALGQAGARRGVQKRDFLKRLRAELSIFGGFFASDLLSSSYDYGGALAFYPFEDFGIEFTFLVTPFSLAVEKPLTQFFQGKVFNPSIAFITVADFAWSPIHFKVRVTDHAIVHGDLFFFLGAGDTISATAQGATFDAGIGLKIYPNKWIAVRFDLRDYVMVQEAIAVERTANNIIGTLGLSVFLPGPRSGK